MKKTLILLAMVAAITSCGSNENKEADNTAADNNTAGTAAEAPPQPVDVSQTPEYKKGLALIGQSDCLGCHKVADRIVGPSYQEVADRYAGKPGAEDTLASKIIQGGAGNWGEVPMTPHPNLSKEDAVAMVKYILLLKQ